LAAVARPLYLVLPSSLVISDSFQQVYSFVPIPGAQQHKRPRRRYEEIERMYKCGWQGCEKAYGTLNHLNAHVTMQSHGNKRTPEGMFWLFLFLLKRKTPIRVRMFVDP
jgi:transcription factor CON7